MSDELARRAIHEALSCNWEEALKINKEILNEDSQDLDALSRAARAYFELGEVDKACRFAQRALKIDPLNTIAEKCLEKYNALKNTKRPYESATGSNKFLEEPGKTKIIPLLHLGEADDILLLNCGELIQLTTTKHRVSVYSNKGKYIGRLPDDIAFKLIQFIRSGNEYEACIKSASNNEVKVFIREVRRSDKMTSTPSFG